MSAQDVSSSMPFIKNLASSDRNARTASLNSLHTFLSSRKTLNLLEAQKLWKGLYYGLWMTDRPIPQQKLAQELANLVFSVKDGLVPTWLTGFWGVMSAQWTEIDVLRMEKFLLLVRRTFAAQLRWAKSHGYQGQQIDAMLEEVFRAYCFELEGDLRKVPVGLRLHCLDIWVDELEREEILEDEEGQAFVKTLGQMVESLRVSIVKPVRERARDSYTDERLPWAEATGADGEGDEEGDSEEEGEEWGGIEG